MIRYSYATRTANIDDIHIVSKLFAASWKYAYSDIVNPEYLNSLSDEHWISFLQTGISEDKIKCILIEENSNIVGAAVMRKSLIEEYPNDGELVCLYLLPEQIGKGAGHILFASIEDLLLKNDYAHCILDVLKENERAKAFYKNMDLS